MDSHSPADGIIAADDVIVGADGTGAAGDPALFSFDARIGIANAINDAEARNPGTLKLRVWRSGVTSTKTMTLETMGAYAPTAPYHCTKSSNVLVKCTQALYERNDSDYSHLSALGLLAANNPNNPSNALYQARALEWAHAAIRTPSQIDDLKAGIPYSVGKEAWSQGYLLIVLAEYYRQTGDAAIFPTLEAYAICHARNQSWFGTTGHKYADKAPDGSDNGAMSGYGAINGSGLAGLYGLALARKVGVNDSRVDDAISRAESFFASYAGKSTIPYGEHNYWPQDVMYDMNGKHGTAALSFMTGTFL